MTEKNISVYKLFFFFFIPSFPATPSQNLSPVKPLLFESLVGGSTPTTRKEGGGGAHYG